jgi:hypothetical protein
LDLDRARSLDLSRFKSLSCRLRLPWFRALLVSRLD